MPKSPTPSPASFAIVDDHRAISDIMGYALQTKLPVKCIARYSTVAEAKADLPQVKPRVVITDWRIGDDTGGTLVKELKDQLPETKWLLFTAWPIASVLRDAVPAGIHGCVSKSADYEELAHAVEEILAGGSYFCKESLKALGQSMELTGRIASLTNMERSILQYIAQGLEAKGIAAEANLSTKTIHNYLVIIRQKTKLGSMVDLARFAIKEGIASPAHYNM